MLKREVASTKEMEQAQKAVEQAKHRYSMAKKKAREERRKAENRHKYMMGGIIHKYLPECYGFEECEMDEILRVALSTQECQEVISTIKAKAVSVL